MFEVLLGAEAKVHVELDFVAVRRTCVSREQQIRKVNLLVC